MKQRILLAGYCANRGGWLLLAVCQFFLLPLVCWLYGLPLQPVLYASIIMATAFLLFAAVDCWRYACRIRSIERQKLPGLVYVSDVLQARRGAEKASDQHSLQPLQRR